MFVGSEGGKLLRRIDKLKCEFFREIKITKSYQEAGRPFALQRLC